MSLAPPMHPEPPRLRFEAPSLRDGAAVQRLIAAAGTLDLNSSYAYLLLCDRFGSTCRLARWGRELAGVVLGFRVPDQSDTVFVWQIAVRSDLRGSGLGRMLLERLVDGEGCHGVRFLEAHVARGNAASEALFRAFARARRAEFQLSDGYRAEDFPDAHAPERLIRIGPLG